MFKQSTAEPGRSQGGRSSKEIEKNTGEIDEKEGLS